MAETATDEMDVGDLVVKLKGDVSNFLDMKNTSFELLDALEEKVDATQRHLGQVTTTIGRNPEWRRLLDDIDRMNVPAHTPEPQQREQLRHNPAIIAGRALGGMMGGAGEMFSQAAYLNAYMGPTGLLVAGALLLAKATSDISDHFINLREHARDFNFELREAVSHFHEMGQQALPSTGLGHEMGQQAEQSRAQADKLREENDKHIEELNRFSNLGSRAEAQIEKAFDWRQRVVKTPGGGLHSEWVWGGESSFDKEQKLTERRISVADTTRDRMKSLADEQNKVQDQRNVRERQFVIQQASINSMWEGPARDRANLELKLAEDKERAADKVEDSVFRYRAAAVLELGAAEEANKQKPHSQDIVAITKQQQADIAKIRSEGMADAVAIEHEGQGRLDALRNQEDAKILTDVQNLAEARIEATKTGYARQQAMQESQRDAQIAQYEREGRATFNISETWRQRIKGGAAQHAYDIETIMAGMQAKTEAALDRPAALEIEWAMQARTLNHDLSLTATELEKIHQAFLTMSRAEATSGIVQQIKQLGIELQVANHHLPPLVANFLKLRMDNPNADLGKLVQLAFAQEKLQTTLFANQQLQQLHPVLALQEYAREVKRAYDSGALGKGDEAIKNARDLLNKKQYDLFGSQPHGQLDSSFRAGEVNLRALADQNPMEGIGFKIEKGNLILTNIDNNLKTIANSATPPLH